jgi:hypothetical protein
MTLEAFIAIVPMIVGLLYSSVAIAYLFKGDIAWAIVWGSYALANVGLILVGARQ